MSRILVAVFIGFLLGPFLGHVLCHQDEVVLQFWSSHTSSRCYLWLRKLRDSIRSWLGWFWLAASLKWLLDLLVVELNFRLGVAHCFSPLVRRSKLGVRVRWFTEGLNRIVLMAAPHTSMADRDAALLVAASTVRAFVLDRLDDGCLLPVGEYLGEHLVILDRAGCLILLQLLSSPLFA